MKKQLLFLGLIALMTIRTFSMTDDNQKNFSVCEQIKKLKHDASPKEFETALKTITKNNLTVCDCIFWLTEQKINKALHTLKNEAGWSDEKFNELLDNRNKIQYRHSVDKVNFEFDEQCTQDDIKQTKQEWETLKEITKNQKRSDFIPYVDNTIPFNEYVVLKPEIDKTKIVNVHVHSTFNKETKPAHYVLHHTIYYNPSSYPLFSRSHELIHAFFADGSITALLRTALGFRNATLKESRKIDNTILARCSRAKETRANQLLPACGPLCYSQNFLDFQSYIYKYAEDNDYKSAPSHPKLGKQLNAAIKIHKLKLTEDKINTDNRRKKEFSDFFFEMA